MNQMALPLQWPADPRSDAFLLTASNQMAARILEQWESWPTMAAILTGPRKSGRSLLARIFAARSGGTIIDDAERVPEVQIFHAWNAAQAERRPLVIVADASPPRWSVKLPDLRSRLANSSLAEIGPPDDELVAALFEQLFQRRGLDARPDLIEWLTARIERSHLAVIRAVDMLDQGAMERRARLSIALARSTLLQGGLIADS
ncbi:DnaA/Hda family protein [Sphingomonadaceae bacterium jetA1]|jgi:chromosomal replication initiation ATPase DnaA|uniref:chromosomal replication initiator DnaA n=1 Tax=Facivitalis istanbulensis TaxID=3075838 RepID=UPI0034712F86